MIAIDCGRNLQIIYLKKSVWCDYLSFTELPDLVGKFAGQIVWQDTAT